MKDIIFTDSTAPTSNLEVEDFEKLIGAKLPADYREFLLKHNGGNPQKKSAPLLEPFDEEIGNNIAIAYFYSVLDDEFCDLQRAYNFTGVGIPEEFLVIAEDIACFNICLGIKGDHYGELYYVARDNYMYKIANNFSDFIDSLYFFKLKEGTSDIDKVIWWINIHDKYSLPVSTHVKKYGEIISGFFNKAPEEVEDYIIEEAEKTKLLLLYYDVKSTGKRHCRKIYATGQVENFEISIPNDCS